SGRTDNKKYRAREYPAFGKPKSSADQTGIRKCTLNVENLIHEWHMKSLQPTNNTRDQRLVKVSGVKDIRSQQEAAQRQDSQRGNDKTWNPAEVLAIDREAEIDVSPGRRGG